MPIIQPSIFWLKVTFSIYKICFPNRKRLPSNISSGTTSLLVLEGNNLKITKELKSITPNGKGQTFDQLSWSNSLYVLALEAFKRFSSKLFPVTVTSSTFQFAIFSNKGKFSQGQNNESKVNLNCSLCLNGQ